MNYNLDVLNRLDKIKEDKDIKGLSYAIFPGTHCPLFGVALTASYIKGLALLVVGTSECTYYTKVFSNYRHKGNDKVFSLVLKENDVVFGADRKVKEAVEYIAKNNDVTGVMVVTTCVPELIGEDYEGIVDEFSDDLNIPVLVIKTEHYKCNSHIPGMTRSISALINLMDDQENNNGINILGHRQEGVENTELIKLLKEEGIEINTIIPSKCEIDEIRNATKAKLNIVTDMIALDLAEKMEKRFNVPYIFFDKHMNKETIDECYRKIEEILEIKLQDKLAQIRDEYDYLFVEAKKLLDKKKFIYGNTPMMAFETAEFLVELGLEPELIQVRELYDVDIKWKDKILEKGFNPYVTRIANIAPLRHLYDKLNSEIYIGHENPMLLKQKGLKQLTLDANAQKIGYELPIGIMKVLIESFKED